MGEEYCMFCDRFLIDTLNLIEPSIPYEKYFPHDPNGFAETKALKKES